MKNKSLEEIKKLQKKINPLQTRIYELQDKETMEVQRPRVFKLIGVCIRSTYAPRTYYGRIIDVVEDKEGGLILLLERCSLNDAGTPDLTLLSESPYLNKEWWDAEIPLHGWEKCPEEEYQNFKAKVMSEFGGQKTLRKWIKKNGY